MRDFLPHLLILSICFGPAFVLVADPPPEVKPKTETRVFDIRELVSTVPDYPRSGEAIPPTEMGNSGPWKGPYASGGSAGGGGGGNAGYRPPNDNREARMIALTKLLMLSVEPESWKDNGGEFGSMLEFDDRLAIVQTPANLLAIQKLLANLRARHNRTLSLEAHWVLLTRTEFEQIAQKPNAGYSTVDLAAMEKLPSSPPHFVAQSLMRSGQTVTLTGGRFKTVVSGLEPVVGEGVTADSPTSGPVQAGVNLQTTITVDDDLTSASADFDSIYSDWGTLVMFPARPTTQPFKYQPPGLLDRVEMPLTRIKCSATLPLNKFILVGGVTLEPTLHSKPADTKQLYLIVKITAAKP